MWNPFRSGPPRPLPPPAPFPWAAALSACVALTALYITVGGVFVPVLLLLTLLPGLLPRLRLDDEPVWLARLGLMGAAVAIGLNEPAPDVDGLVDPRVMGLFGQACACELVVILWRRRVASQGLVGLPAMVMLAATNTFDDHWVRWLAPPYLLLTAMAARGWRARGSDAAAPRAARRWGAAARAAAFALLLACGAASYAGVYLYRGPLNDLGMRLLSAQKGSTDAGGMAAQPQLGATFGLRGSLQRVLRIEGVLGDPHLHGVAYDTYRGGRWFPTSGERRLSPFVSPFHAPEAGTPTRVIHLADDGGLLLLPLDAANVRGPAPLTWDAERGGPLQTTAVAPFVSEYAAAQTSALWPAPTPEERARCLSVPAELSPKVAALARQVTAGKATVEGKADAIATYLMSTHGYSLMYTPVPGDPVSGFVLSHKPAHCEYFAAAATLMLRCAHVPARYITGYYAHEADGKGVTVVRGQDAHAWCEAWNGTAWITADATPGDGRPPATAAPVPATRRYGEGISDALAAFRRWVVGLSARDKWLLVGAMALSLIVPQIVRARRRQGQAGPTEFQYAAASQAELAQMSAQFTGWLARENWPCPPGRPWGEHVRRWTQTEDAPPLSALETAENFVRVYSRLRFGREANAGDLERARVLLGELEQAAPVPAAR